MKIKTFFEPKPIPDRRFDWSAIDDDTYDCDCDSEGFYSLSPVGYGSTEAEAIADLEAQIDEELFKDSLDDTERFEEKEPSFSSQTGMEE